MEKGVLCPLMGQGTDTYVLGPPGGILLFLAKLEHQWHEMCMFLGTHGILGSVAALSRHSINENSVRNDPDSGSAIYLYIFPPPYGHL